MANYEAGLHKDVLTIFKDVWTPHIDNIQQSVSAPVTTSAAIAHPKALVDHWVLPKSQAPGKKGTSWEVRSHRRPMFSGIANALKQFPGQVFKSRTRQEKKRLESISRHLLINLPS
jgi:hypothetical protein